MDEINVIIQIKIVEQYIPVVLFIIMCEVVSVLESVDKVLERFYSIDNIQMKLLGSI